nr:non-ribosomal peptide synthetase [Kibdelosporangium sp. MJ126-NF4]CEL12932.1 Siderophore biosynthesis non-ribosomal peptide synthetase modules @ Bacillibactin synthetase component F [Kibdelosporangium sp. MJ126-NF4]CTQ98617.1 Siderophore biosynthesis non-ribosomal peptide synthetase modules @ Bacillibactin synthetase component F (EC 2.7.7.-) [Kibdelosporangium sp. MJ126-NF4]
MSNETDVAALRRELLRRALAERDLAESAESTVDTAVSGRTEYPLSAGQRRMWALQQLDPHSAGYNIRIAVDLHGPLDYERLVNALHTVVARHDILRTTYRMGEDDHVTQVVHPHLPPAVDHLEGNADELCRDLAAQPFDLATASPLRLRVITTGPEAATLIVVAHHIAWDDSTSAVFFGELMAIYRQPEATLPRPRQFADIALTPAKPDSVDYWRTALDPLPDLLDLPTLTGVDRAAGGHDQSRPMRPGAARRIRDLARQEGASTFMVLLAAVTALLHRYTGSRDLLIGAPVVNRDMDGGDEAIGYLGNTIALRMLVDGSDTFGTLLARAKQACLAGYTHQDSDLDDVARVADPERTRGGAGLFNVVLSLRTSVLEPFRAAGFTATRRHVPGDDARFDLTLAVETDGEDLAVEANHPKATDSVDLVSRLLAHFDVLLDAALARPDQPIGDIDLLTEVPSGWNDTSAPAETRLLPDLFTAQATRTPDATAVLADGERLTYRELDERSNRLARLLIARGIGPESTVALSVPRSVDMVTAVLAVTKAGGAYVPVDPDYPADRVRFMLSDAQPVLVLTPAVLLDTPLDGYAPDAITDADRTTPLLPDHPAYVIYTSGSTGVPKGVVVSHRALSNHLAWSLRRFTGLAGHTLTHSSISFDFTVTPLFGTLIAGGTLELCAPEAIGDAAGAATFLKITPSHLPLLPSVRFADRRQRTLVIAGEALRGEALSGWSPDGPIDVINEYGPTETTVGCLLHDIDGPAPDGPVPVGFPVDNTTCHVLDGRLRPVPVGVAGELYVGGVQLARGYLHRPGLTATRFVASPLGQGERLYRTGDRVRRVASGAIEFLGRTDDQVKIRGFRVEPGEIESVLLRHADVAQAVVVARTDAPSGVYLAGYVVLSGDTEPDMRAHVAAELPEHMVPSVFMVLDALPLSPSGKVERRSLPAPRPADTGSGRAPANDVERTLATLFAEVLNLDSVAVDMSFFELGGDSIVSIRLVRRARQAGLRITPRDVFAHRTVEKLAAVTQVDAKPEADTTGSGRVEPTPIMRSFAARGPWGDRHRMSIVLNGPSPVDPERLERAVQAILDRHDSLRAHVREGALEFRDTALATSVIRRADSQDVSAELERAARELSLTDGVVLKVVWFESQVLVVAHHLVVDGVSWRVFVEDLADAYAGRELAPVPTSFRRWAKGLADNASGRSTELEIWRALLDGPGAVLGRRAMDPRRDTWATVRTHTVRVEPDVTDAVLTTVPAAFFAGIDDILLAALSVAVREPVLVLLERHGREQSAVPGADLSRTMGWFTSQHPVRLDASGLDADDALAGGPAAGAAVRKVKEHLRSLPDNGIGFGVLRHLHPESAARLAVLPEPQLGFNYLGRFDAAGGDWAVAAGGLSAAYDDDMALPAGLVVNAITEDTPDGPVLTAHWMYASEVFDHATVSSLAGRWVAALRGLARHAHGPGAGGRTPSDVSLVSVNQRQLDALEAKWKRG